jgi:hypothetical protein
MQNIYELQQLSQLRQRELLAESENRRRYNRAVQQKHAYEDLCHAIRRALKAGLGAKYLTTQFNLILGRAQDH